MKLLRSITRRGFEVGTAGSFTVLKPNTWFPASRLPQSALYRVNRSVKGIATHDSMSPQIMLPSMYDRRPARSVLIVLSAIAITSALLWWIIYPF